jgi:hypothetical protein
MFGEKVISFLCSLAGADLVKRNLCLLFNGTNYKLAPAMLRVLLSATLCYSVVPGISWHQLHPDNYQYGTSKR